VPQPNGSQNPFTFPNKRWRCKRLAAIHDERHVILNQRKVNDRNNKNNVLQNKSERKIIQDLNEHYKTRPNHRP